MRETLIETDRLILRPFTEDDKDIIYRLYSDGEVLRYTPYDRMDRETAEQHLHKVMKDWQSSPRLSYELAVIMKESGEKVGRTHILIDPESGSGMIGWFLLKPYWGNHFAEEMTAGLLEYCFKTLQLPRVYALCNPLNTASRKVLEKSGFRMIAIKEKACRYVKNGEDSWQDEAEYAITASEYEAASGNG